MKKIRSFTIGCMVTLAMTVSMATTAFAGETRVYFTEFGMAFAPYRVTNVISQNGFGEASTEKPEWYEESFEKSYTYQMDIIGSVEITKDSLIYLDFRHQGVKLTTLDQSIKKLTLDEFIDVTSPETLITDVNSYLNVGNLVLEEPEEGFKPYYLEGSTVQFKKTGTYLLSTFEHPQGMNEGYEYYAPIIFKVVEGANPKPDTTTPTKTATSSSSAVLVNGQTVDFDAYTIDQNNYFKLRDIAKVLEGSEKSFEVSWDESKKAINLSVGKPYTAVGSELTKGSGGTKKATVSTATILKDGVPATLKAYTIDGNSYFKLRDLGEAFDFNVAWDAEMQSISIDTSLSYGK